MLASVSVVVVGVMQVRSLRSTLVPGWETEIPYTCISAPIGKTFHFAKRSLNEYISAVFDPRYVSIFLHRAYP